jgi:hypothetical protein
MGVACGIVGLPNSGKSTLFNAFTASRADRAIYPFSTTEAHVAVVNVPDDRLERIHKFVTTERIVPAVVQVVDIPGLVAGSSKGEGMGNKFLGSIKETDAILQVVRCFERAEVMREGPVDPKGDMEILELELAMADLDTVTRGVERVTKKARAHDAHAEHELATFKKAKALLEEGRLLRTERWTHAEVDALRHLFLITMKPMLYVANVGEEDIEGKAERARAVHEHAAATGAEAITICGDLECELVGMEPADREQFMKDYGLVELSLPRLIRATYHLLGLQTFFTAGPKEIRAWTFHKGDKGPMAASVIHTDFEKGYVRAEVYSLEDLEQFHDEHAIKAHGKLRVEGREYVMREGDIAHFLIAK